ncbi:MAG: GTA-gp10 family protein [Shimia thalassica]|uniref:GTA-gp10 family protein n=1 Tax=Shimia thalassica TaxID=1715693 RepID=UPI003299A81A
MSILKEAPRGGVLEEVGGQRRPLLLKTEGIETFEDTHRAIYEVYDGLFGRSAKPKSKEVRDLIALGLVGGGMPTAEADAIVEGFGPKDLPDLLKVAQAMVGIAFHPDVEDRLDDDEGEENAPEKPQANPS